MIGPTQLFIRLNPGPLRIPVGEAAVNRLNGGPETLLRWLETQLGLPTLDFHRASSVNEYARALDSVTDSMFAQSYKTDRWATAAELLQMRDELLLSGWNPAESDSLPEIARDLAKAATESGSVFLCVADRLGRIVEALNAGQQLPLHVCTLTEPPEMWPPRWRSVLAKLTLAAAEETLPSAPLACSLHACQSAVRGNKDNRIAFDSSLRFVQTLSQMSAVEFVAATLSNSPHELAETVIVCDDDVLAMQLDASMNRLGLPTMGVSISSKAHPVLQVLPLSLALCWEPVDPQCLLDFLSLPVSPIPRVAASRLAEALSEEPGLGSSRWQTTLESLLSPENDPEKKLAERIQIWLMGDRVPQGQLIPSGLVAERCRRVAQWAIMRATAVEKDEGAAEQFIHALHVAAAQASLLGELVENQGTELSEPQLARLLEEALADGVETIGFIEAEGGPTRVRSLAEIDHPCQRLIWLGLGTNDMVGCRWSTEHLAAFRNAGIDLDDGSRALSALRSAEARGLCFVESALLAIALPQDLERRWHPIWLAIRNVLSETNLAKAPILENLISAGDMSDLAPFTCHLTTSAIEPAHGRRERWAIPAELIQDRESVSASELQDRLACPLKWVLNYQARLRSGTIARLPDEFRLRGKFCHSILERVFGNGGNLPSVDVAVSQVADAFDERIAHDAAPLAQSDKYLERQKLRKELLNATGVFIATLASGGYRIKGIEFDVSGEAFGKTLNGRIDCLVERDGGNEAIIDFKYSGRKKYSRLLENGKAVQLATYAYGRSTSNGAFPAVAYLILSDGLLFTPSESPIQSQEGLSIIDGIGIAEVWEKFSAAIDAADGWLTGLTHVPARPLLEEEHWTEGCDIVLEKGLKPHELQPVCEYCDYKILCGLQELY